MTDDLDRPHMRSDTPSTPDADLDSGLSSDPPATSTRRPSGQTRVSYDAFISYSHAADGRLAPALQHGLQRFAKRWTARRALRVFRDDTGLSVNTALWPSIQASLDESRFFILLASPEASGSVWVDREVSWWIELGRGDRILPVLTDGDWVWDPDIGDFDWERSTAVPRSLEGAFTQEPRHLDLRWADSAAAQDKLHLRNGDFRSAIAELAAPIHGRPKDELESRDLREHRKARVGGRPCRCSRNPPAGAADANADVADARRPRRHPPRPQTRRSHRMMTPTPTRQSPTTAIKPDG